MIIKLSNNYVLASCAHVWGNYIAQTITSKIGSDWKLNIWKTETIWSTLSQISQVLECACHREKSNNYKHSDWKIIFGPILWYTEAHPS